MESFHQGRSESIIVVRSNERELVAGLVVDQLFGFRNLHGLSSTGSSTLPQYAKLPYISRVLETDSQQLAVLDAEKLLGSAEFCRFWL
jgi:chemotaxis signal transduction protein